MNNTTIILYSLLVAVVWFAPVFLIGSLARHWLRKDGDKVIIVGLIFGVIGAAIAAAVLPRLSDEEWEAKGKKPERSKIERDPVGQDSIVIIGLVVGCLIAIAGIVTLQMI